MKQERCISVVERDKKVVAPCSHLSYFPLVIDKCKGSTITDVDGNQFIDFLSSASSLNMGSTNPIVTQAIKDQLDKFSQYTVAYTYNETTTEYMEKLCSVFPGGEDVKICVGNCGSDGNDAAVKFARAYTGRQKIIVFRNGYHGNTYGSSTMTTCSTKMHEKMGPFLPEIYVFPFFGIDCDDETVEKDCLKEMTSAFESWLPANEVAAVVIEPVQGDGGMLPAHPIFMKKLYELCKANGILFISEEVQQGFWRTGKFFAIENYDIVPDGLIMGKSMGAGLTLGGFMAKSEIMDCLPAPAHLFTLGGNAAACAAGNAAFDYYQTEEFQTTLKNNIALLTECVEDLKAKYPDMVEGYRQLGMSMSIIINNDDPEATFKTLYRCYEKGLLIISIAGNILRVQPPLNIPADQLKKGFEILAESLDDYKAGKISDEILKYKAGW